jgi:hypothetical protein
MCIALAKLGAITINNHFHYCRSSFVRLSTFSIARLFVRDTRRGNCFKTDEKRFVLENQMSKVCGKGVKGGLWKSKMGESSTMFDGDGEEVRSIGSWRIH